jgi:hypothetical protein
MGDDIVSVSRKSLSRILDAHDEFRALHPPASDTFYDDAYRDLCDALVDPKVALTSKEKTALYQVGIHDLSESGLIAVIGQRKYRCSFVYDAGTLMWRVEIEGDANLAYAEAYKLPVALGRALAKVDALLA